MRTSPGAAAPEKDPETGPRAGGRQERREAGPAGLGNCKGALEIGTGSSDPTKGATESSLKTWKISHLGMVTSWMLKASA